ncbi:plasmid mobilization relaxosome protein MobC [Rufibacter sp. XAAS-G3-1]|uniref:plasmid mobilization protein n=1 Tax=Rufibacter sp. XAAS-G3-1 TaxID=2729134 RepID=UPI0015E7B388|nr:plasmid mobilization relaxosome protein MobC [Rufibacter sp. XAAS-G3-1]
MESEKTEGKPKGGRPKSEKKEWNPKGGRPKKEAKEKKDFRITLRFTDDEFKELEKRLKDSGYDEMSTYARLKLLSTESNAVHNPRPLLLAISKLNSEIHKVGVNINQIAKYVNYLDRNKMIDPKLLGDYNTHFKRMMDLQSEFLLAIRTYLRSNKKK